MQNSDALAALLQQAAKATGSDPAALAQSAKSGKLKDLTGKMQPQDARRFQAMLNDPKQVEQLLNSPQAKALLKLLAGQEGKKHGGSG